MIGGPVHMFDTAKLKVASEPAFWNRRLNPFNYLLSHGLISQGVDVFEFSLFDRKNWAADAILLHWPKEFFVDGGPYAQLKSILKSRALAMMAKRGIKILWVAHNLQPHDTKKRGSLLSTFFKTISGVVYLSDSSRESAIALYPELKDKPWVVAPHGHYLPILENDAREWQRPAADAPLRLGSIGQIRPYKNLDGLMAALAGAPDLPVQLTISGSCPVPELKRRLEGLVAREDRAAITFGFLSEAEMETALAACDAAIYPYNAITNSGSLMMALSVARPSIVPRAGSMEEMRSIVGPEWMFTYEPPLTSAILAEAVDWVRNADRGARPDLSAFDWPVIASSLAAFLSGLRR